MAITPETAAVIKNAVETADKQIPALKAEINRAAAAGIDVTEQKNTLAKIQNQVQLLKTHYAADISKA